MIIFCILARLVIPMWHFFWESIVLPSLRLRMRFRLFALRDELRSMRITNPAILEESVFIEAERRINATIQVLPSVDPFVLQRFHKELSADKPLIEKIEKRAAQFEAKAPAQVLQLMDETAKIGLCTAFANSGAWAIYAIPLATAIFLLKKLKLAVREVVTAPPHELEKIVGRCPLLVE